MCGHAIIALGRWAVDSGRVEAREPETEVAIQAPCGLVRARVQVWRDGGGLRTGAVSFRSVPSFAFAREIMIDSREWGPLQLDIASGGAFYAILPADSIGPALPDTPARHLPAARPATPPAPHPQPPPPHPPPAPPPPHHPPPPPPPP